MNEKKKLQPKVRFREFTGENAPDWEQRKLGEVFSETISYVDPKLEDLELWSVTTENGLVPKESRYNRQFLVKKTDKFKKIFPNEIVYNPMNMTLGSIGFNNLNKVVAVSGYYVTMKLKLGFNSMYFAAWLPSNKAIRLYKIFATGSLTERQRIQFSTLKDIKTCIPLESEQRIIGHFFEKLEDLLTLHQRKLEQLEQLKNTLLSKMFPKSGTNIPEIRFSGFTDAWKQYKMGCLIEKNIMKNKNLKIKNVESVSNRYGFIKQTEQFDDYTVASNDLSNYYIISEKYFAYNPSRINVGSIAYKSAGNSISIVSPLYVSFSTKELIDDRFLWYWFKTSEFKQQREKYSEGGVRDTLSYNQLSKMKVSLPELNEQIILGKYLDSLVDTIAIHQRKLEQLKNLKQTLLNKMFI